MFGRDTKAAAATLSQMHDQARIDCKYNQSEIVKRMAQWMADDRRFDSIPDKQKLAAEVIDARVHGRQINLTEPVKTNASSYVGHVIRSV